jgi:hypothetical protein
MKGAIQRNWQYRVQKTKTNKTKTQRNMCWTPLYVENTNNVNKTYALLQTNGGTDELNIVCMRKSYLVSLMSAYIE